MLTPQDIAEIYERAGALVLRRCRIMLGNAAEAEDALQEVFIRLLRFGDTITGESVSLSWLYRTAERCCLDRLRGRKRERLRATDLAELAQALDTTVAGPCRRQEVLEQLHRLFVHLDEEVVRVALLYHLDGLTQDEIALELDLSRRTIGKRLKAFRERVERLGR